MGNRKRQGQGSFLHICEAMPFEQHIKCCGLESNSIKKHILFLCFAFIHMLTILLMPGVWVVSHTLSNYLTPAGILQFNSVLMLSIWREHWVLGDKGSDLIKLLPASDAICKSQVVTCASELINLGSHDPLLGLGDLLECLTQLREILMFIGLLKRILCLKTIL